MEKRKRIITIAINTAIVVVYYILAFLVIPKIPVIGVIEDDLDWFLISLPVMLFSIVMIIVGRSFHVWIIPDIVYFVLMFAVSSESFHPYGVGLYGIFDKTYRRDVAFYDGAAILAIMLILQATAKLILRLAVKIKSKSGSKIDKKPE